MAAQHRKGVRESFRSTSRLVVLAQRVRRGRAGEREHGHAAPAIPDSETGCVASRRYASRATSSIATGIATASAAAATPHSATIAGLRHEAAARSAQAAPLSPSR
jgi:hypothetical protein